jgi:hypothetical protein
MYKILGSEAKLPYLKPNYPNRAELGKYIQSQKKLSVK